MGQSFEVLTLPKQEVHVWHVEIDSLRPKLQTLLNVLSFDEQNRFHRFVCTESAIEFCVCRSILRLLLEKYGVGKANEISFCENDFGKPSLALNCAREIKFNISHSRNVGLLAFANDEVGVDVEVAKEIEFLSLTKTVFSSVELDEFNSLADNQKLQAFFRVWTRKEALVKGVGQGLNVPLDSFGVSFDDYPRIVWCESKNENWNRWRLSDQSVRSRYTGAVAYRGYGTTVLSWKVDLSHFSSLRL